MTVANKITSGRFLLCIVYYALLTVAARRNDRELLGWSFVLYQVIAWSDLLDGYLARRYKQVTLFGRIADPLVDKILVCGSFIFFLTIDSLKPFFTAWFGVVVLGREFLVSGIRVAAEAAGIPFGASFWGKLKAFIQMLTAGWGIGFAAWTTHVRWTAVALEILVWVTLASTVISGATYVVDARRLLRSERV